MSTQGRLGVNFQTPAVGPLDPNFMRVAKALQKVDADPIRERVMVSGQSDATLPPGQITDGITLAVGASINIAHGLGHPAAGFIPITTGGTPAGLINDTASLSSDLQASHIRIRNNGGTTVTFKVLVVA